MAAGNPFALPAAAPAPAVAAAAPVPVAAAAAATHSAGGVWDDGDAPRATNPFGAAPGGAAALPAHPPPHPAAARLAGGGASYPTPPPPAVPAAALGLHGDATALVAAGDGDDVEGDPGEATAAYAALGASLRSALLVGVPDRRGVLKKMGGFCLGIDALKSVVDRWVELRGPVLEYYSNIREAQSPTRRPRGVLLLDETSTLTTGLVHDKIMSPYTFMVETRSRSELFAASSEPEFMEWVAVIHGVLRTLGSHPAPHVPPPVLPPGRR